MKYSRIKSNLHQLYITDNQTNSHLTGNSYTVTHHPTDIHTTTTTGKSDTTMPLNLCIISKEKNKQR